MPLGILLWWKLEKSDLLTLLTSGAFVFLIVVLVNWKIFVALLRNITEFDLGFGMLKFGHSGVDAPNVERLPVHAEWRQDIEEGRTKKREVGVQWQNTGNLFWLGQDFQWCISAALRGADRTTLAHGLNHCCYHSWSLGLELSHPGRHLDVLEAELRGMRDRDLTPAWRESFVQGMNNLMFDMGSIAMANQPDFEIDVVPPTPQMPIESKPPS